MTIREETFTHPKTKEARKRFRVTYTADGRTRRKYFGTLREAEVYGKRVDLDDELDGLISKMLSMSSWTRQKFDVLDSIKDRISKARYKYFYGRPHYYFGIKQVGQETVMRVPPGRRGFLKRFRNKTIRLICIGSGRFERQYAAGVTTKKPVEGIQ